MLVQIYYKMGDIRVQQD